MYLQSPLRLFARIYPRSALHTHPHPRHTKTHLATGVMPQILPIHVKLAMVIHMHELVCQGIFHVFFAPKMTLAEDDGTCGMESARTSEVARATDNVAGWNGTTRQTEMLEHEDDFWTCSSDTGCVGVRAR